MGGFFDLKNKTLGEKLKDQTTEYHWLGFKFRLLILYKVQTDQ